jgi:hypothetical protein
MTGSKDDGLIIFAIEFDGNKSEVPTFGHPDDESRMENTQAALTIGKTNKLF